MLAVVEGTHEILILPFENILQHWCKKSIWRENEMQTQGPQI